jgi:colanic acid biosynthesis glycosyl transferase WcaI
MRLQGEAARRRFIFVNRYFDPDESASSQMLTDLARGLVARGFDVHVVCSGQLYTNAAVRLPASEEKSGVAVHRVATTRFGRARLIGRSIDYASFYCSAALALFKLLRGGDIVIAKTDPPLICVVAALIARIKRASLVNWQQDVFPEVATLLGASPLPKWLDSLLRRLRDSSLRGAEMNVLISSRMLEYFRARDISTAKLCVIENWADGAVIRPKPVTSSTLRSRLGLENRFVVGYSGNLGRAHEYETLLASAATLQMDNSIVFLMVGGGAMMEILRLAVTERALGNFRFLPYQDRDSLEDSLAAADVHLACLLPALEGLIMPSKAYGILAAGRPLIFIGDLDGDVARMIGTTRCGIAVEVNAHHALAAAILRLQADPEARAAMGARARTLFLSRYTLEMAIERWVCMFRLTQQRHFDDVRPPELSDR